MNRETKFRGKDVKCGTWVYGFLHQLIDGDFVISSEPFQCGGQSCILSKRIDPETVGQLTGLKDRNGAEIFEGDTVRWRSIHVGARGEEHIDNIEWSNEYACYTLVPWIHEPYAAEMEVIGNIHDKPENN